MGHRQREILCIDDDPQSLKVRGILLESMGYKVLSEPDAERGLHTFLNHDVDAVLMDYQMPGMSGGEAAVEMKRLRPEIPVLIVSGEMPSHYPDVMCWAAGFLSKPFQAVALRTFVRRLLETHVTHP